MEMDCLEYTPQNQNSWGSMENASKTKYEKKEEERNVEKYCHSYIYFFIYI